MSRFLQGHITRLREPLFLLAVVLVVGALVYIPGLSGDFAFDDTSNLLINDHLRIERLDFSTLRAAAFSGDAGPLKRPLSMLSFALNYYATGFDPFYFKLVNLGIHLLNGASLYLFLSLLLSALAKRTGNTFARAQHQYLALVVTASWLLHPLALTSVLYVVQRMNSLAALFTLWGLIFYLWGRRRLDEGGERKGIVLMVAGILGFGMLASLSKENGVLLPLYALVLEATIFGFRTGSSSNRKKIYTLFIVTVAIPLLAATLYVAFHPEWLLSQYRIRAFTLSERLLTESRVLWLYIKWMLVPNNADLGLFHDDIPISTGFLQPITTLVSILAWLALLFGALLLRKRVPLVSFGLLWFLAGHSLESSFLGLELAHEHRNYLPMIGILLIAFDALFTATRDGNLARSRTAVAITVVLLFGVVTSLRAAQWSSSISLNLSEAQHHPESVRANYQAGRQYTILFEQDPTNRKLYDEAWFYLDRAARLDHTSTVGLFGLISLAQADHRMPEPALLTELQRRLRISFFGAYELLALKKLAATDGQGKPAVRNKDVLALFDAALDNPTLEPGVKGMLFSTLSAYYANQRHAYPDAVVLASKAIEAAPKEAIFNTSFADLLIGLHQYGAAREQLRIAKAKDHLGRFIPEIASLEQRANHHEQQ